MEKQFHLQFIKSAKKFKKRIAFYDQTTQTTYSYGKLLISCLIFSNRLKEYDEKYIGILLPTSAGAAIAILATLMAGKIPVILNYSTGARKNCLYGQEKCGFKKILTSKKLLDKLGVEPVAGMEFMEDIVPSITLKEKAVALWRSLNPKNYVHKGKSSDVAFILFTSGSEKHPKAVQLTHKNIMSDVFSLIEYIQFSEEDVFMCILPFFHVFGLVTGLCVPISFGCGHVLHANPLEYQNIVKSVKKYRGTVLIGTPTFFHGYLQKSEAGDFASVRIAITGADKLSDALREGYLKKHNITIYEGYGATETSPVISVNSPGHNKPGSIGRPLTVAKVKIVGVDSGEELPRGEEGKILVKGDLVMKGYLGDKKQTDEVLKEGWYDTGDMGVLDSDGYLWHRGRLRRFVKIGGEMVSLVAIEAKLREYLDEECQVCVVDVPHPVKGSEIVVATTRPIHIKEVTDLLTKDFPPLAIPKRFLQMDSLPVMGNGKIDFRTVTERVKTILES